MGQHLERTVIVGSFKLGHEATAWGRAKLKQGYTVTRAIKDPFAFSNQYPWEVTATSRKVVNTKAKTVSKPEA